jgi:hypothetical protein
MAVLHHNKYVTFNREEFNAFLAETFSFLNPDLFEGFTPLEIEDAVVIRRQDQFASPCLLTYASMISMVAQNHPNKKIQQELQIIADYFHQQGVLAGEEGWKLPTP